MKKLVFFVMSAKGFYALRNFIDEFGTEDIDFAVSTPDKNMAKDYYDEIAGLCSSSGLRLYERNAAFNTSGRSVVLIGWRWMIRSDEEMFVFHDSILPGYRGFSALVSQLLNKEPSIGITSFYSEKEYDSGDIIGQRTTDIVYPIKISKAIDLLCPLCYGLLRELYLTLKSGKVPSRTPQDKSQISYSIWRDEEDYRIDWNRDSEYIKRFIDTVGFPYKGASAIAGERKIRIHDSESVPDCKIENRSPGKVIFEDNGKPIIICGSGLLKLHSVHDDITGESVLPLTRFRTRFA